MKKYFRNIALRLAIVVCVISSMVLIIPLVLLSPVIWILSGLTLGIILDMNKDITNLIIKHLQNIIDKREQRKREHTDFIRSIVEAHEKALNRLLPPNT